MRYKGLAKNTAQLFSLFGLANLLLAHRWLLDARAQGAKGEMTKLGRESPQFRQKTAGSPAKIKHSPSPLLDGGFVQRFPRPDPGVLFSILWTSAVPMPGSLVAGTELVSIMSGSIGGISMGSSGGSGGSGRLTIDGFSFESDMSNLLLFNNQVDIAVQVL